MPSAPGTPPDLRVAIDAIRVCKRPIVITVVFASASGVCQTREGAVRYRAGDAIVTGLDGEHWPVGRREFADAYEAASPAVDGHDGMYVPRNRSLAVFALQLGSPISVSVGPASDALQGRAGDWLLQYNDGSYGIVSRDLFARIYEPCTCPESLE